MCQTSIYYCFEKSKMEMDIENILKVDIKDEQDKPDRNLVCITFPGIVKNDANAIKCLGGLKGLSQVYSHSSKKRLGLSFNPDNPYVKKIYGDCKNIPGILFKVKVKKTRVGNEIKREVISTTVVGRVEKTFKFDSMSDFQYLPISDEPATSNKCLVEKCLPSGLDSVDYMEEPAPLFLLPGHFTRTDKPTNYEYIEKRQNNVLKKTNLKDDEDSHNRMRADRKGPGINITFDLVRDFPTEAHEHHIKIRDTSIFINSVKKAQYETVRKLFEERPIWSHNLIRYKTHIKGTTLKPMLPCLAFYLNNGPWKKLWIRHGYDPRKDPESRKYQTLDFRFRSEAAIRSIITCRDDTVHGRRGGVDTYNLSLKRPGSAAPEPDVVHESSVIVRPGLVPMQRQMYYQYVDVLLPEVQAKLLEPPAPGLLCHQARGWLPPDAERYCRQIIYKYSRDTVMSLRNSDIKLEMAQESSGEDDDSLSDEGSSSMPID